METGIVKIWLTNLAREVFRWYLRRFPWRDGKAFFYRYLHEKLAPPDGWVNVPLARGFTLRLDLADPEQRQFYFFGDYDERRVWQTAGPVFSGPGTDRKRAT